MTVTINAEFQNRLRRVVRRHNRMVGGVRHKVTKDGLIIAQPRVFKPRFPLKGILMLLGVAVLFKAFLYADLGQRDYNTRVQSLQSGSIAEQMGAYVMAADPVTVIVGDVMRDLFR